jgi:uncharacterized membrane protein required for colicin V production
MIAVDSYLPAGVNWYDGLVVVALVFGAWTGVRTGLAGEIIRVLGIALALVVGVRFYEPAGDWLKTQTPLDVEVCRLVAFVGLAVMLYSLSLLVRVILARRKKKFTFAAVVENVGGGLIGIIRMGVAMALLTLGLCLIRSPFWHEQVGQKSRFGSFVVARVPSVQATVEKHFPEKSLLFKELKRPGERTIDETGPEKK